MRAAGQRIEKRLLFEAQPFCGIGNDGEDAHGEREPRPRRTDGEKVRQKRHIGDRDGNESRPVHASIEHGALDATLARVAQV